MADYHNIFSGDYWSPDGYKRRKQEEAQAAQELAIKQGESNRAPWEAIGGFLGDAGNNIGKFFGGMDTNRGAEAATQMLENQTPQNIPFAPTMQRSSQQNNNSTGLEPDFLRKLTSGQFGPNEARTPQPNFVESNGYNPEDEFQSSEQAKIQAILDRLGARFEFDPSGVDTSPLDSVLKSNMDALNGVRATTNQNFQQSDNNVRDMFAAHQKGVQAQAPGIQQRGAETVNNVNGVFNPAIQQNTKDLGADRKVQEEMLQRLGIAPAANQPDLMGQAVQEGNNQLQNARTARAGEAAINTQTDLSRNTSLASAVGNDGINRRADLNMRLQEILGGLAQKETGFQNDYQQGKLELLQGAEDKSYDRWLQDRQFDMGLFNSINSANAARDAKDDQFQNNLDVAEIKARGSAKNDGSSANWLRGSSPSFQNAFFDVSQKVNIDENPQRAIQMLADPKYGLDPAEVVTKIKDYTNLGKVTPISSGLG